MPNIIISDTSCLIILTNIGELELLHKLYGKITTTLDIAVEYGESLPEWIDIKNATDKSKQQLLELQIDKGESSAIALALEIPDCTIILDDNKARKVAHQLRATLYRNDWCNCESEAARNNSKHQTNNCQNQTNRF